MNVNRIKGKNEPCILSFEPVPPQDNNNLVDDVFSSIIPFHRANFKGKSLACSSLNVHHRFSEEEEKENIEIDFLTVYFSVCRICFENDV